MDLELESTRIDNLHLRTKITMSHHLEPYQNNTAENTFLLMNPFHKLNLPLDTSLLLPQDKHSYKFGDFVGLSVVIYAPDTNFNDLLKETTIPVVLQERFCCLLSLDLDLNSNLTIFI